MVIGDLRKTVVEMLPYLIKEQLKMIAGIK
jgi:hypothetical protein